MNLRSKRIEWLRHHALPIRTLDPEDRDFDDLEAMASFVGDARIVQLGEGSHTSGKDFLAKSRLVAFLHQRMGFEVLVWESGMYDCRRVDAALRAGVAVNEAAPLGIFDVWARTREARAVLEYARRSHATSRPLSIAGFDCQFSGTRSRRDFLADLRTQVAASDDPATGKRASRLIERAVEAEDWLRHKGNAPVRAREAITRECGTKEEALARLSAWWSSEGRVIAPTRDDWLAFDDAASELLNLLSHEGLRKRGRARVKEWEFWTMAVGNWRVLGEIAYERYRWRPSITPAPSIHPPRPVQTHTWNLRERRNALVVEFLADRYHRGRKLILWAHNLHVMNARVSPDWASLSLDPDPNGVTLLGSLLAERYGADLFSVGFVAHAGMRGWPDPKPIRDHPLPGHSFEALCHELDLAHALIPFTGITDSNHPMRQPMAMSARGYRCEPLSDWTRAFHAVLYVDEMAPPSPADPCGASVPPRVQCR